MKIIKFSPDLVRKLKEIKLKDSKLSSKIQKKLELFQVDQKHLSLRLHKITKEVKEVWIISIGKSVRMLYRNTGNELYFFEIGTHDEVYRKR